MPQPRFIWHPDARAFAGTHEAVGTEELAGSVIPAQPVAKALEYLRGALHKPGAFCVSNTSVPGIDQINPAHFATLTGGTSGAPKIILRTQLSWIDSFQTNSARFGYTPDDRIATLGDLSHSLALYAVLEGLHLGLTVHALSGLTPRQHSTALSLQRSTILYATPTQLSLLPADQTLPDVRLILCGGGALNDAARAHINKICPAASLLVFYGAAETSFIAMGDANTPRGSVGQAYPHVEIAVRAPDSTGIGTIWVRSPYLFEGYLQGDSGHTVRDGDWLTVGELGSLDEHGNLFLRGRAGRVFNIADQTIYPEDLEMQFNSLPGVIQCAVLARLDPLRERHLVVVFEGPESTKLRQHLLNHCAKNNLTRPRHIVFLDSFPMLPSGKPDLPRIANLTGCTL